jgi:hypothetical protein
MFYSEHYKNDKFMNKYHSIILCEEKDNRAWTRLHGSIIAKEVDRFKQSKERR